ncbi:MAG: lysophospholipid acyltransferase family protein, partial [Francisellaceae bacterium]
MMKIIHKILVGTAIAIIWLWSLMPIAIAQFLGLIIGWVVSHFNTRVKRTTTINLKLCFPDLSDYHLKKLVKGSIIQTMITGVEMPAILFKKPQKLLKLITAVEGRDLLQTLYDQNRGVMVLGPHIGCWEIGSLYFPAHFPAAMLYTPPKIAFINNLIVKARSRLCKSMSPANHTGVRTMFQSIKNHELVAMLSD